MSKYIIIYIRCLVGEQMDKKTKNKVEFIFQIIIVCVSLFGLVLNFLLFDNIVGILYYTILSNAFVFIFYLSNVIFKLKKCKVKTKKYYMLKGLMLLSILCTMIIYNVVLTSSDNIYANHKITCNIVHVVVPLLVLFECLLLEDKKVLKYKYLLSWSGALIIYFLAINIYSLLGGLFLENKRYPYDFLDITSYGVSYCLLKCLLIFIFYLILGSIIIFVDNKMKERK